MGFSVTSRIIQTSSSARRNRDAVRGPWVKAFATVAVAALRRGRAWRGGWLHGVVGPHGFLYLLFLFVCVVTAELAVDVGPAAARCVPLGHSVTANGGAGGAAFRARLEYERLR